MALTPPQASLVLSPGAGQDQAMQLFRQGIFLAAMLCSGRVVNFLSRTEAE